MKAAAEVKKTELEIKQQELALQTKELEMLREKQVVNTASPTKVRNSSWWFAKPANTPHLHC
jgi:hypothetical protein